MRGSLCLVGAESVKFQLGSKFANVQASVIVRIIGFLFGQRREKLRYKTICLQNTKGNKSKIKKQTYTSVERGMMGLHTSPHHLS